LLFVSPLQYFLSPNKHVLFTQYRSNYNNITFGTAVFVSLAFTYCILFLSTNISCFTLFKPMRNMIIQSKRFWQKLHKLLSKSNQNRKETVLLAQYKTISHQQTETVCTYCITRKQDFHAIIRHKKVIMIDFVESNHYDSHNSSWLNIWCAANQRVFIVKCWHFQQDRNCLLCKMFAWQKTSRNFLTHGMLLKKY